MTQPKFVLLPMLLMGLAACASITEGTTQTITIETNPDGADCRFLREGIVVASLKTPGGVVVEKTKHDMTVECEKDGYEVARANLESGTEGATWGNILLGGGIGWAIDSAAGADNKYPEYVNLTLPPNAGSLPTLQTAGQTAYDSAAPRGGERWVGQGAHDACGTRWSMDLQIDGKDVTGTIWRNEVGYSVRGSVLQQDDLLKARATKTSTFSTTPDPLFLAIQLSFHGDHAEGNYAIDDYGRIECISPVELERI